MTVLCILYIIVWGEKTGIELFPGAYRKKYFAVEYNFFFFFYRTQIYCTVKFGVVTVVAMNISVSRGIIDL